MTELPSNIEEVMRQAAQKSTELDTRLQQIFLSAFGLLEAENVKPEERLEVGYKAYGLAAVDVAVRLAKLFIAVKQDKGVHSVACDLTYQLNTNDFWAKNASVLLPVMHIALNSHTDGVLLLAERERRQEYSSSDALISASRAAPLELFPLIAYCLGGPMLMTATSLRLKHELAPYIL